jgi:hypothetical protein
MFSVHFELECDVSAPSVNAKLSECRMGEGGMAGLQTPLLATTALAFFGILATIAIEGRGSTGLPDIVRIR